MAHEDSGLTGRETQNCFVIQVVEAGYLCCLKIDARFASQGRVNNDPLEIIVRLKPNTQCFARSRADISWRARSRRAYNSGRLFTQRWNRAIELRFSLDDVGIYFLLVGK